MLFAFRGFCSWQQTCWSGGREKQRGVGRPRVKRRLAAKKLLQADMGRTKTSRCPKIICSLTYLSLGAALHGDSLSSSEGNRSESLSHNSDFYFLGSRRAVKIPPLFPPSRREGSPAWLSSGVVIRAVTWSDSGNTLCGGAVDGGYCILTGTKSSFLDALQQLFLFERALL